MSYSSEMRFGMLKFLALICAAAVVAAVPAATTNAQKASQRIGPVQVRAATIDITSSRWTLNGGPPQVWTEDGRYKIKASRIVVDLRQSSPKTKAANSLSRISQITATGSVTANVKTEVNSTDLTAATATFNPSENKLVCEGGVVAVVTDPNTEEPTRLEAKRITVWYNPQTKQMRTLVEGDEAAPAELRVVPKEKPAADKKAGG